MNAPHPTAHKDVVAPRATDIDLPAFARALDELKRELRSSAGEDDLVHLRKIERWGRACTALGYATAWIAPNAAP